MVVKTPFTNVGPTLINYDFADILSDVGYVTVFAMIDLANNETLVRQTIESNDLSVDYDPSSTGLQGESNFDYEFRTPTRLDGLCYVKITYFARASGTQTASTQVKVRLIHLDTGASETEIGAQQAGPLLTETTDSTTTYRNVTFTFDINQTFAKDEKIRLEVEVYSEHTVNSLAGFLIDPANRDHGQASTTLAPSSQLKVLLPFPLET